MVTKKKASTSETKEGVVQVDEDGDEMLV